MSQRNGKSFLLNLFELETVKIQFPHCHVIKSKLLQRDAGVRLHIFSKDFTNCKKNCRFIWQ